MDNPNVKSGWPTLEIDAGGLQTVTVIETDLHLNALHPEYQVDKVDALLAEVQSYQVANRTVVDRIRIVPIKR